RRNSGTTHTSRRPDAPSWGPSLAPTHRSGGIYTPQRMKKCPRNERSERCWVPFGRGCEADQANANSDESRGSRAGRSPAGPGARPGRSAAASPPGEAGLSAAWPAGRSAALSVLAERLIAIHDSLDAAGVPHAFGGAIALAYCTEEPRGTRDLDV